MNYKVVKLNEICESMYQGINTSTRKIDYVNRGISIISGSDIYDKYINFNKSKNINEEVYNLYKQKYNPKKGDLLFCNIGSIGKVFVLQSDANFLISWNIFLIRLNQNKCMPEYLKWVLIYFNRINKYDDRSKGGAIKFISKKNLSNMEIPIYELNKQKQIVHILNNFEIIINNKKEQLRLLENLKNSLFFEMFNIYINNNSTYRYIKDVVKIVDYRGKFKEKSTSGIRLITSKNIGYGYYKEDNKEYIKESEYKKNMTRGYTKSNDVILITEGGSLGNACRVPNNYETFALGQRVISFSENESIKSEYLESYILQYNFQEEIKIKSTGSYAKGIRVSELQQIMIPVPPVDLQIKYKNIVNSIEKSKCKINESIINLENKISIIQSKYFEVNLP